MPVIGHHLFYAILPPAPQRTQIAAHRSCLAAGVSSIVSDARLHLTLGITPLFASFPDDLASRMRHWASEVAVDPFALALDRLTGWADPMLDHRGALCLRPARRPSALGTLSRQLCAPLIRHGALRRGWTFNPHVTLLYRQGASFERAVDPIAWRAGAFVLIHSIVGAHCHHLLRCWPLASRQAAFDFG